MNVYRFAVSLCCLMMALDLAECWLVRRRRGSCEHGTYQHEGKTCCLCPAGSRLKDYTTCTDSIGTNCEHCQPGSFTTQPNRDHACQPCKSCDPNAEMETKEKCSLFTNTVCECTKGHYCDKGDLCKMCYTCDTCEERGGVKMQCTATNNTVCNSAKKSNDGAEESNNGKTIGAVIGVMLIVFLLVASIVFVWKKKKFCFRDKQTIEPDQWPRLLEEVPDVDLNPYLQEIASIMKPALMKKVARHTGMLPVDIDQHEENHPKDVKEQTYRLLQDWSQSQGLNKAYPTLIKTLQELKAKTTADQIRQIVERKQATATQRL